MTDDGVILKEIYVTFCEAEKCLLKANDLMRKRPRDLEIEACIKLGGRAGWSRFLTAMHNYVEQYGLKYLHSQEEAKE